MNERIKELNRQALFEVLNGQDPDKDIDKMYIPAQFTKTFAELIIEEMYCFMVDATSNDEPWPSFDEILEHFGVEE
jgi:hypothetical protein